MESKSKKNAVILRGSMREICEELKKYSWMSLRDYIDMKQREALRELVQIESRQLAEIC